MTIYKYNFFFLICMYIFTVVHKYLFYVKSDEHIYRNTHIHLYTNTWFRNQTYLSQCTSQGYRCWELDWSGLINAPLPPCSPQPHHQTQVLTQLRMAGIVFQAPPQAQLQHSEQSSQKCSKMLCWDNIVCWDKNSLLLRYPEVIWSDLAGMACGEPHPQQQQAG